jgi:hypothetical protein
MMVCDKIFLEKTDETHSISMQEFKEKKFVKNRRKKALDEQKGGFYELLGAMVLIGVCIYSFLFK